MNIERKFNNSCCSFEDIKIGECFEKLFDYSAMPGHECIRDFDCRNIYIKVYQFVTDLEIFPNHTHELLANAVNLKTGMPARFDDEEMIGRVNAKLFIE